MKSTAPQPEFDLAAAIRGEIPFDRSKTVAPQKPRSFLSAVASLFKKEPEEGVGAIAAALAAERQFEQAVWDAMTENGLSKRCACRILEGVCQSIRSQWAMSAPLDGHRF